MDTKRIKDKIADEFPSLSDYEIEQIVEEAAKDEEKELINKNRKD